MQALSRPSVAALLDPWSVQPVALAIAVALSGWYLYAARRRPGWPARRTVAFLFGIALLAWTTCGFLQAYARSLYWVWTTQTAQPGNGPKNSAHWWCWFGLILSSALACAANGSCAASSAATSSAVRRVRPWAS